MNVELSERERELLVQLIDREVSDLGPEIRHTQTYNYRDELKDEKRVLADLARRLRRNAGS
ncbi:MAG: hypothetical protein GY778_05195 [bacterium]|nr:hypothetical protein [bacterium]